jgi:hypothetical protein
MNGKKSNFSILLSVVILLNLVLSYQQMDNNYGYFIGLPNEKQHDKDSYFHIFTFRAYIGSFSSRTNGFEAQFLADINTKSKIVYGVITPEKWNPIMDPAKEFYFLDNNHYFGDKMTAPYKRYLLPTNRNSLFQKYYVIWDMQYNLKHSICDFKIKFFDCKAEAETFKTTYFSNDLEYKKKVFLYDSGTDPLNTSKFASDADRFRIGDNNYTYRDLFLSQYDDGFYISDNTGK